MIWPLLGDCLQVSHVETTCCGDELVLGKERRLVFQTLASLVTEGKSFVMSKSVNCRNSKDGLLSVLALHNAALWKIHLDLPGAYRTIQTSVFFQEATAYVLLCPAPYSEALNDQTHVREIDRSTDVYTYSKKPKSSCIHYTNRWEKNPIVCILAITAGNWTWDDQDRQGACPGPRYLANTTGNHIRLACLGKANIPAMLHISHQLPGSFSLTMNFLFAQNSQSGRKHTVLSKWKKSWSISALYSKS